MSTYKYLVILESPGKVAKVQSYLGKDYKVVASYGHCIDLPKKKLSINIKKDFQPTYEIYPEKKDKIDEIIKLSKSAQIVFLMTDEDREGEAISYHISNVLPKNTNYKRAKTNSITKVAVEDAIKNAGQIDYDLVNSYETRRILDRLVGYKCSYVTTSATGGKSAGRVQSAALRVLAEREKEIQKFVPVEYWEIGADFIINSAQKLSAKLVEPDKLTITNQQASDVIVAAIQNQMFMVSKYEKKEVASAPKAPFTTSTLQQTAASVLGWDQDRTMRIAQKLYEDGHITYMRTDSVSLVPAFISSMRTYIQNNYKSEYLPKTVVAYANKAAAQAAHEAIRPVDIGVTQIVADAECRKLYDLIWRRTLSSQMANSRSMQVSVRFNYDKYEFAASGSVNIFDGWKNVYHWSLGDDKQMPFLQVGEKYKIDNIIAEQKFTQPPSRYTKSSITKMYEETGIGRPSTYANITKTLKERKYIEVLGNSFKVTDLGIKVCDFLVASNFCFIDLNFTSNMEDKLDQIGDKKLQKLDVLKEFWKRLESDLTNAVNIKQKLSVTTIACPKCNKNLAIKNGKFGSFYACVEKDCKFTANIGAQGEVLEKVKKEKVYSEHACPTCNCKMIVRSGRFGEFLGCESYPKCTGMRKADGTVIDKSKKKKRFFKRKNEEKQ